MSVKRDQEVRTDPRDYVLDISSLQGTEGEETGGKNGGEEGAGGRAFLSIFFKCCGVYQRIYQTADGTAYAGFCPKCARAARIGIGPRGSTARAFIAE